MMNVYSLRRCFLFVVSLFINALGIDFITKALLGTSPITGVNYVLSLFTPLTMGQWTIIVNILFMLFELPFMTHESFKEDLRPYLLQIPISLSFGIFIDWGMNMLFWVVPVNFVQQIVYLLIGCCVLAMGIALEMKVNVAMTAGEFFVKVIAQRLKHPFGFVKLGFDVTLVLIACIMSYLFSSTVTGVGLGTVVSALLVGPIVHMVSPFYRVLDRWLLSPAA